MFRAITGASVAAGGATPALFADVRGDARLGPADRLDIYARMYRARLVDVLREDYPRVAATLGRDAFAALAQDYIAEHPSTHPSLRWFGRHFADHLAAADPPEFPPYLPDLARLEWARLAVFDAPDAALLALDTLRRLTPDEWTTLRLQAIPALEILPVEWPVHRIWEAASDGPAAGDWRPEATVLRVWRQGDIVYQARMDDVERRALGHVRAGDEFVALCAGLADLVPAETAAATAGALVLRWIEDGVLRADRAEERCS